MRVISECVSARMMAKNVIQCG